MNAQIQAPQSSSASGVNQARLKLLGIFAIAAVPVILAALMYFGRLWIPSGTTNHGELVLPPQDATFLFPELAAAAASHTAEVKGATWKLITLGSGPCEKLCQESLYKIRQVNAALGRDAGRVSHALLALDQTDAEIAQLQQHDQRLQVLRVSAQQLEQLLPAQRHLDRTGYDIYVVDPHGNLMMRYRQHQDGHDLLDDMQKLLRVSKIG